MENSRLEQQRRLRKSRNKRMKVAAAASAAVVVIAAVWLGQSLLRDHADSSSPTSASIAPTQTAGGGGSPSVQATQSPKLSPSPSASAPASGSGVGVGVGVPPVSTTIPGKSTTSPSVPSSGAGDKVSMAFTGDVIFAGNVETILKTNGYDYPYREIAELLQKPDFTIANLETPITTRGDQQQKQYTYRSSPDALPAFKAAGFDIVNLANNHILDYGQDGLLDTIKALDA